MGDFPRSVPEETNPPEQRLATIAAQQHGVVTTAQLAAAGILRDGVTVRVISGQLHRIHRGVYAVGHPRLSIEERWMGAVLACGPRSVLSHRSAARLWGLLRSLPQLIDVTIPHEFARARRRGVRLHRSRTLAPAVTTTRNGIPVTTPARTIADLRRVAPPLARRALREAAVIGLHLPEEVEADQPRSELEARFLRLCRRHRLVLPEVNVRIGAFVVDFLWREQSLIAETDGFRFHSGRQAFEDDRARDTELRLMGYEVVRFTFRQVSDEAPMVASSLRQLLELPQGRRGHTT